MSPLYGLVACGGKSSRMGFDKSTIVYHEIPQRYHVYNLLKPFCEKTFISCNQEQILSIPPAYAFIMDEAKAEHKGPVAALVSAFQQFPNSSFLLVGCDYPFLQSEDIARLVTARRSDKDAVCYFNSSGIEEPLLAIYEKDIQQKLMDEFDKENYSLRSLLRSVNTIHCSALSETNITSVDDKKTFDEIQR